MEMDLTGLINILHGPLVVDDQALDRYHLARLAVKTKRAYHSKC